MNRSEPLPRTETLDYLECRTMPKDEDIKIVKNIYLKNLRDKCIILIIWRKLLTIIFPQAILLKLMY